MAAFVSEDADGNGGGGLGKNGGPTQTIVIEQAPLKIIAETPSKKEEKPYTL